MSKTIVITGISKGLGKAMTDAFTDLGHKVIGCSRSSASIKELKDSINDPEQYSVVDVTDNNAVQKWADYVTKAYGPPDYLINNAAIINENLPFWELPVNEFDDLIDINLKGVANVTRAYLPSILKAKKGIIINFSSGYGQSVAQGVAPYCCSKFGIEGFTKALAEDLPQGIAAIPLSPGIINTDMLQRTFGHHADEYETAESWAKKAIPYILGLNAKDSGKSMRVPQ